MSQQPDLIEGYLSELRAGLQVTAEQAGLIVAEAEDHLREAAARGLAAGMTEREAQEAAISAFGSSSRTDTRSALRHHIGTRNAFSTVKLTGAPPS
jgi:hypothetical protein